MKKNKWDFGVDVKGLKRWVRDLDKDGVLNRKDCRPLNPRLQDDNNNGPKLTEEDITNLKEMDDKRDTNGDNGWHEETYDEAQSTKRLKKEWEEEHPTRWQKYKERRGEEREAYRESFKKARIGECI